MFIEVIAKSVADVREINKSNFADQIEYCINLQDGGLTPGFKDIAEASKIGTIPIRVMIRTNSSYMISNKEYEKMEQAIKFIKTTETFGIVFGWITEDGKLEQQKLKRLVDLAFPLKCTFHRAFDHVKGDPIKNAKLLETIGFDTILTSGFKIGKATDNYKKLLKLQNGTNIRILCGQGIDKKGYLKLQEKKLQNIHLGSVIRIDNSWDKPIDIDKLNKWNKN